MTNRVPLIVPGYGPVISFDRGQFADGKRRHRRSKVADDLASAIVRSGLQDGGTVSFHHHLRDGDDVLNMVMGELSRMGFQDLHVAASSLFPVHATLVEHIMSGVVTRISSAYISGPVAKAISTGKLAQVAVLQTHGGRARAIAAGELKIDAAFIAAPSADSFGNLSGSTGPSACGPLGYAMVDARHAQYVIGITDNLGGYPLDQIDIPQDQVDEIVEVGCIGNPAKIVSGTTRITTDPVSLQIASTAAQVIAASGLLVDGFSFQTGAGGTSLAVAAEVAKIMRARGVIGGFVSGGITSTLVDMHREGLFRTIFDVQAFDLDAVESYRLDPAHMSMSAELYASPGGKGCVADQLDVMILGAAEVDLDFNVNVSAVSGGRIIGGSGGHADTAACARLAIVTTQLRSKGIAKIVDRVECLTTPGETIDVVVTEAGVAVNPRRGDLLAALSGAGIETVSIEAMCRLAAEGGELGKKADRVPATQRVVAVVEYRDGTAIDVIRQAS